MTAERANSLCRALHVACALPAILGLLHSDTARIWHEKAFAKAGRWSSNAAARPADDQGTPRSESISKGYRCLQEAEGRYHMPSGPLHATRAVSAAKGDNEDVRASLLVPSRAMACAMTPVQPVK